MLALSLWSMRPLDFNTNVPAVIWRSNLRSFYQRDFDDESGTFPTDYFKHLCRLRKVEL